MPGAGLCLIVCLLSGGWNNAPPCGCLSPSKRTMEFTVATIDALTGVLQPNLSRSEVVDEWKLLQVDSDLPTYDKQERIENTGTGYFN